jgi:hypothetical protein
MCSASTSHKKIILIVERGKCIKYSTSDLLTYHVSNNYHTPLRFIYYYQNSAPKAVAEVVDSNVQAYVLKSPTRHTTLRQRPRPFVGYTPPRERFKVSCPGKRRTNIVMLRRAPATRTSANGRPVALSSLAR